MLKVLSNISWGADRTSLLRIYQAMILSRIDYGCAVYGSACNSVLRKLDPVHHSALRICSGAFRTSPIESLYAECTKCPSPYGVKNCHSSITSSSSRFRTIR
ncbi:hypothetical protein AVEN_46020-1 [Araneus ventricosus]|uniref:Reverse transcriptase domain-containing protein n=1 Tax=Araneus ventricosus TaxID=182803 RepID=A0A4Y2M0L2_ARAVE|nr:hypothetical protein AVEN_46020-1 [Araneus ventricosus]